MVTGDTVGMCGGDVANDAPALRQAQMGMATDCPHQARSHGIFSRLKLV